MTSYNPLFCTTTKTTLNQTCGSLQEKQQNFFSICFGKTELNYTELKQIITGNSPMKIEHMVKTCGNLERESCVFACCNTAFHATITKWISI